jgi:hypothetical protein
MKFIDLLIESKKLLDIEDEIYLSYQLGHTLSENEYLRENVQLKEGLFWRIGVFLKQVLSSISPFGKNLEEVNVYIFVSTLNQLRSIQSTIESIKLAGVLNKVSLGVGENFVKSIHYVEQDNLQHLKFRVRDACICMLLFVNRAWILYSSLKAMRNEVGISKYFNEFCLAYLYLPGFLNLLSQLKPEFVIVANDHSTAQRCLRLAAERLKIKTVFMQHGAGTAMLPPLQFDFAFLDGQSSLENYLNISRNSSSKLGRNLSQDTCVFLSGSKKFLSAFRSSSLHSKSLCVGLAVNPFDRLEEVFRFIDFLLEQGINVVVRCHPAQPIADVELIGKKVSASLLLDISSYRNEPLDVFLGRISFLVAGKSSIHLEALLASKMSYYMEFGESSLSIDKLEHLKGGFVKHFPKNYLQLSLSELNKMREYSPTTREGMRYFSETFSTNWQGLEGELVLKTLMNESEHGLGQLYSREDSTYFSAVYRIRL